MSFKPFLAYSASAGSGKTFALSVRYISLLFMGESPRSILAATFTNKAAAEMRQRVVDSLRHLEENRAFLDAISIETGMERETLLEKQPKVLETFLASPAYIVTLDSFFSMILRSASLELGLEPDFITRETPEERLEQHFLEELESKGLLSSLVRLALTIDDKRFQKIFALMQTFYTVDPLLPVQEAEPLDIAQEESACEALRLEMLKALENAGASMRCLKQFDTKEVKVLFEKKLFEKETLGEHSWFKNYVNSEIETLYRALKQQLARWSSAKEQSVLKHLFTLYDYYKNATISNAVTSGVLTFDDLSYFTYRLLYESISKEFLYFKIDAKFRHILLDEFQDTSTLQYKLLEPLIEEIFAGEGQNLFKSFFYVGDTKQSLYRFRGGVEALFDWVSHRYEICVKPMDTNYRSSRHIVEQVNLWFQDTMEGYIAQKSREGAKEGYVEVFESEALIEDAVVQIETLLKRGICIDEIALLVNTNKEGLTLQEACEKAGIATLLKTSSSLKYLPRVAVLVTMLSYLFSGEKIDAEPLLQSVGKTIEEINLSWFSVSMNPLQILDRLIREFGYFAQDSNLLKLLEFASSFSDIPTFLEAFAFSNISVAAHSVHGANIMTIHGSKGLEFQYVIVLDKLTKPNYDKNALLFHYSEALLIEQVYYRIAKREHFDREYAQILQARERASRKDRKNVLYVALTRAIEGLIVIKKPHASLFDEIAMVPMKRGVLPEVLPESSLRTHKKEAEETPLTLSAYGTQEVLEREEREEKDLEAMLFGTALHYALEMLGSFDAESIESAMFSVRNRYGQKIGEEGIAEIEKRIRNLIETQAFQALLKNATITKEQSLSFEGELKQVDLLLRYDTKLLVVDYKSSKKYFLKHQAQVNHYKKAIEHISQKPTSGALIYLLEEGIEIVNLN